MDSDISFMEDDCVFVGIKPPTPMCVLGMYSALIGFCIYCFINVCELNIVVNCEPGDQETMIVKCTLLIGGVFFWMRLMDACGTKQVVHIYKQNANSYSSLN
jgi:hypothetical protein